MTKQEAEVMAERLTRIWKPGSILEEWKGHLVKDNVVFVYPDKSNAVVNISRGRQGLFFDLTMPGLYLMAWGHKARQIGSGPLEAAAAQGYEEHEALKEKWLPFFRRGCWLSGCPIEASAHEKAEWIQGFTREEMEAWNLKM